MSALATSHALWGGYRVFDVEPLELTVKFTRPLGVPKYMVCGIGDDGEAEVMFQGEFHDTIKDARESAWAFAEQIIAQGLDVSYRSDLES